jgi:hypothetical protein
MNDTEYKLPVEQISYMNNPIYQNFLQSPFYDPKAKGLQVITPVQLPTGEFLSLPNSSTANQFRQYLSSTPAGGAPGLVLAGNDETTKKKARGAQKSG